MNRRLALALVVIGWLVSSTYADMTIYAPGSTDNPASLNVYAVPGVTIDVPLYLAGTGYTISCDVQVQYHLRRCK